MPRIWLPREPTWKRDAYVTWRLSCMHAVMNISNCAICSSCQVLMWMPRERMDTRHCISRSTKTFLLFAKCSLPRVPIPFVRRVWSGIIQSLAPIHLLSWPKGMDSQGVHEPSSTSTSWGWNELLAFPYVLVHWLIYGFIQMMSYKQLRRWIGHFTCVKVHCTNASTNLVRMDRLATRPTRRTCKWNPSMPTWSCSNHYKLYKIPWQVDIIQIFPSCLANKPQ